MNSLRRITRIPITGLSVVTTMNIIRMVTSGARTMGEEGSQTYPAKFRDDDLKERLNSLQYHVTQDKGTERAFTGEYVDNKKKGMYNCIVCGHPLFSSSTKFESGSGWPSFSDVATKGNVRLLKDVSHGMVRTEVVCNNCGAHLGHVFEDGPKPTGLRYCMNSASLNFHADKDKAKEDL